jgi:hypothetical protein
MALGTSLNSNDLSIVGVTLPRLDEFLLSDPELVGDVELSSRPGPDAFGCGSHTATAVPDLENNRLPLYNATSGGPFPFVSPMMLPRSR